MPLTWKPKHDLDAMELRLKQLEANDSSRGEEIITLRERIKTQEQALDNARGFIAELRQQSEEAIDDLESDLSQRIREVEKISLNRSLNASGKPAGDDDDAGEPAHERWSVRKQRNVQGGRSSSFADDTKKRVAARYAKPVAAAKE